MRLLMITGARNICKVALVVHLERTRVPKTESSFSTTQGKLPGNTGLDGHSHRQNYSVIAPYACRFESVVGTLEDGLMHSFFAIVA